MVQITLIDLIDFLDTGPAPRHVPMLMRRTLSLGGVSCNEEIRNPQRLDNLYHIITALRDSNGDCKLADLAKYRCDTKLHVFVEVPEGRFDIWEPFCKKSSTSNDPTDIGDCPYLFVKLQCEHIKEGAEDYKEKEKQKANFEEGARLSKDFHRNESKGRCDSCRLRSLGRYR